MFDEAANLSLVKLTATLLERLDSYLEPDKRIVQIMPAGGYNAYYYDTSYADDCMMVAIVGWGLTERGMLMPLCLSEGSTMLNPMGQSDCMGVYHHTEVDRFRLREMIKIYRGEAEESQNDLSK